MKWHISSAPTPPSTCSARAYKRTRVTQALHVRTIRFVSETTHKHTCAKHTPELQTRGSPCRRLQPLPPPAVRECADQQGWSGRLSTSAHRPSHWRNEFTTECSITGLCTCKPLMFSMGARLGPAPRQPLASSSWRVRAHLLVREPGILGVLQITHRAVSMMRSNNVWLF